MHKSDKISSSRTRKDANFDAKRVEHVEQGPPSRLGIVDQKFVFQIKLFQDAGAASIGADGSAEAATTPTFPTRTTQYVEPTVLR